MNLISSSWQFILRLSKVLMTIGVTFPLLLSFLFPTEVHSMSGWRPIVIGQIPRGSRPWGGRGGFCDIAGFAAFPSEQSIGIVWSDQPSFVWQGNLEWVEIRSADGQQVIQRLDLLQVQPNESINSLISAVALKEPLQPGATYRIVLKAPRVQEFLPVEFQVISTPERDQITADLQALAAQGVSQEEIARQQADYFADRALWADYWQTILSVEQPSESFKAMVEAARRSVCESPSTSIHPLNSSAVRSDEWLNRRQTFRSLQDRIDPL